MFASTLQEKCTIVKNFHKDFKKADYSYIGSSEFSSLLSSTLLKIKDSRDTFVHLKDLQIELKAHKRRKIAPTASINRKLSSSSEHSEAVSIASNLEIPIDNPPKQVPTPNLADKVASAILPNFKQKENGPSVENTGANDYYNVPCSSKQADIIENLNFSMPVNNGIKLPSEFKTNASDTQSTSVDRQSAQPSLKPSLQSAIPATESAFSESVSVQVAVNASDIQSTSVARQSSPIPANENAFSESVSVQMADPVQVAPDSDSEIEVVNEVVIAAQKDDLLKGLNLESVYRRQRANPVDPNAVQIEQAAVNLPPIPVAEDVHQPETSRHQLQPETSTESAHPVKKDIAKTKQKVKGLPPSVSLQKGVEPKEPTSLQSKMEDRVHMLEVYLGVSIYKL